MTVPNASVTLASGDFIATHLKNLLEYQAVMLADDSGHLEQTVPTYTWFVPSSASAASKLYADIFNPSGSGKIVEIRGVWCIPKNDTAVAPTVATEIMLLRTSATGTGGTAYTYNGGTLSTSHVINPWDTANTTTLTTSIVTARSLPTGGATISAIYFSNYVYPEETQPSAYICSMINMLPVGTVNQRITLNEGQGLLLKNGTAPSGTVGSYAFLTLLTVV